MKITLKTEYTAMSYITVKSEYGIFDIGVGDYWFKYYGAYCINGCPYSILNCVCRYL